MSLGPIPKKRLQFFPPLYGEYGINFAQLLCVLAEILLNCPNRVDAPVGRRLFKYLLITAAYGWSDVRPIRKLVRILFGPASILVIYVRIRGLYL